MHAEVIVETWSDTLGSDIKGSKFIIWCASLFCCHFLFLGCDFLFIMLYSVDIQVTFIADFFAKSWKAVFNSK